MAREREVAGGGWVAAAEAKALAATGWGWVAAGVGEAAGWG